MSYYYNNYRSRRRFSNRPRKPDIRIEYPSRGATYSSEEYGVYEYSTYSRSSVLSGQQKRVFLDSFLTLEEAQKAYPNATFSESCGYQAPYLDHLPEEDY